MIFLTRLLWNYKFILKIFAKKTKEDKRVGVRWPTTPHGSPYSHVGGRPTPDSLECLGLGRSSIEAKILDLTKNDTWVWFGTFETTEDTTLAYDWTTTGCATCTPCLISCFLRIPVSSTRWESRRSSCPPSRPRRCMSSIESESPKWRKKFDGSSPTAIEPANGPTNTNPVFLAKFF